MLFLVIVHLGLIYNYVPIYFFFLICSLFFNVTIIKQLIFNTLILVILSVHLQSQNTNYSRNYLGNSLYGNSACKICCLNPGEAFTKTTSMLESPISISLLYPGLVLVILFCLCCTRTDSPLFNICSTKVSKNYSNP